MSRSVAIQPESENGVASGGGSRAVSWLVAES